MFETTLGLDIADTLGSWHYLHAEFSDLALAYTLLAVKYRLELTWSWASRRSAAGWSFEALTF